MSQALVGVAFDFPSAPLCCTGMRNGKGKGKGYEKKDKDVETDVCYDRDTLLTFGIVSAAKASKEPLSPGSLHTRSADQIAGSTRARAATDSAHPAVAHKATTVILKNVPVDYGRTALCEDLAAHGFGYAIDFIYLPVESGAGFNAGNAYINVRSRDSFRDFKKCFHGVPTSTCLPAFDSDKVCEVAIAEVQGRDAHMQILCTPANLAKWMGHDEWQPLFLDDYGTKIPLVAWKGVDAPGLGPRPRSSSEQEQQERHSPKFTFKAPPVIKDSPQTKASPSLRAEAKEFSPSIVPGDEAEATVLASSLWAQAAPFSPPLNADANEFVPSGMMMPELVLEPALVD